MRVNDSDLSSMFHCLKSNEQLVKLRLSGIALSKQGLIYKLATFLEHNDMLTDLDLSYTKLQVTQLTEIFAVLPHTISLSYLNIAFNTIEYARAPELAIKLFKVISNFLIKNNKLIHLDFSGCNFGEHIV